jgi:hypothetical protein
LWVEVFVVSLVKNRLKSDDELNFSTSGHVDISALIADLVRSDVNFGVLRNHWTVTGIRSNTVDLKLEGDVGDVEESIGNDIPFLVEYLNVVVGCRNEPGDVILDIGWNTQGKITIVDSDVEDNLSHVVSTPDSEELLLVGVGCERVKVLIVDVNINENVVASSLHASESSFLELVVTIVDQELSVCEYRLVRANIERAAVGACKECLTGLDEELVVASNSETQVSIDRTREIWVVGWGEGEWVSYLIRSLVE